MIGTGSAFNVQLSPTEVAQQAAAQTTRQATGGQPAPADTDLIQPTSGLLQTGVDGYEAYYDSFNTLRDFADTAFLKYGVDVTRPDAAIPGSAAMMRMYNRLFSETQNLGMQLRTGYETQRMMNEAALRGDIFLPAQFANGRITTSGTPMQALPSKTEEFVNQYNNQLNTTKIVSQTQLQEAQNYRQGLIDWMDTDYKQAYIDMGYDPEYVRLFVEDQKKKLRQPMMDEYARQTLSTQAFSAQTSRMGEQRQAAGAQQQQAALQNRAAMINSLMTDPNSPYLGVFTGGSYSGGTLGAARRTEEAPEWWTRGAGSQTVGKLVIPRFAVSSTDGEKYQTQLSPLTIDVSRPDSWATINNLINSTLGQNDRIPSDDLMSIFNVDGQPQTGAQQGGGGQGQRATESTYVLPGYGTYTKQQLLDAGYTEQQIATLQQQ